MIAPRRQRLAFAALTLGMTTALSCSKAAPDDAAASDSTTEAARATASASGGMNLPRDSAATPSTGAAGSDAGVSDTGTEKVPADAGSSGAGNDTTAPGVVSVAPDTARGTVRRVGSEPGDVLVLEQVSGTMLALAGPGAAQLRTVEGLEVAVSGRLTTERMTPASPRRLPGFDVASFIVRAVDGREAHDGVLVTRGGEWFLRMTKGGERRIEAPPAALREQAGARVWITGPLGGPPRTFGVIHR